MSIWHVPVLQWSGQDLRDFFLTFAARPIGNSKALCNLVPGEAGGLDQAGSNADEGREIRQGSRRLNDSGFRTRLIMIVWVVCSVCGDGGRL